MKTIFKFVLAVLVISMAVSACDFLKDAGVPFIKDTTTTTPSLPVTCLQFVEDAAPGDNSIYLAKNAELSSCDTLAIDIKGNNLKSNVFGGGLDIKFDSANLKYTEFVKDPPNKIFAAQHVLAELENKSDKEIEKDVLLIGVTNELAQTANPSGMVTTLKFIRRGGVIPTSDLNFRQLVNKHISELRDSNQGTIAGVSFIGGKISEG